MTIALMEKQGNKKSLSLGKRWLGEGCCVVPQLISVCVHERSVAKMLEVAITEFTFHYNYMDFNLEQAAQ